MMGVANANGKNSQAKFHASVITIITIKIKQVHQMKQTMKQTTCLLLSTIHSTLTIEGRRKKLCKY
jgi:hypothetical protein